MNGLPHRLDRTIVIEAPRDIVFEFFADEERWASWWGAGSRIDPRPGGVMLIRYPGGTEASGQVLEVKPPERIVFSYGYASGSPIGPGASRVSIRLETIAGGTRLHLAHEFADERARDEHVQGWRYQLSLFANVVTDRLHANAEGAINRWFQTWADPDPDSRARTLSAIAVPAVTYHDRFSCITGREELSAHIGAAQRFMPGLRLSRTGGLRHCQGMILVEWNAIDKDNAVKGTGISVFVLNADRLIASATGFR